MYNAWFVFVAVLFVMVMLLFAVLKCCLWLMNCESSLHIKDNKATFFLGKKTVTIERHQCRHKR